MPEEYGSVFEKHGDKLIQALILVLILWAGNQISTTGDRVTRLEVTVTALKETINQQASGHYSQGDATRDLRNLQEMLNTCRENSRNHHQRLNELDVRVRNVEMLQ